jgi:hypothetical protein
MSDEQLNTAIDEVARRMTEGSPAGDAGFRRRVLARIEAGDPPRARWRPLFVVVPLAAAIVIAVVVTRNNPGPFAPGAPASTPMMAGPKEPALRPVATSPTQTAPVEIAGTTVRLRPDTTDDVRSQALRPGELLVPALPIDAIAVAPLGVDRLAPDPISIERLETIVPLAVAPLDSIEEQRRYE